MLGSEGTIESKVYQTTLAKAGIRRQVSEKEQYLNIPVSVSMQSGDKETDWQL